MSSRALRLVIAASITVFIVVVVALIVGRATSPTANATPGNLSADAGFSRDMQFHHDQAVEMALIIRDNTDDEQIRRLAYDIATSQAQQSGQMFGWLASWGLPQNSSQPQMEWMADSGHKHDTTTLVGRNPGLMPGMASAAEITELTNLRGVEAERLFLDLMIEHHRAGVEMAEAILERTQTEVVRNLAQAIVTAQSGEIVYMNELLGARSDASF
ncbi:DUF305 domain-containing protein [Lysinibacter sp. HNR]|uniref:DUF305 domain-containing protein n=1 Tax=Lysinibacter sp. HNR TaxID=3031408 RepID=UPI0024351CD7|nr:DUF305 domain-containing protein [Lysinibacter sp. HNR]WGD36579.1 DUF305 domain-containing protein [Lysinibacter sp. HNR]